MRILYIILLLLNFSQFTSGQISFLNSSLLKPDSNIIYVGIDNRIEIKGLEDFSKSRVVFNGQTLYPTKSGSIIITTANQNSSQLRFYNKSRLVAVKEYHSKFIPEPVARLGNYHDTIVSLTELVKCRELNIVLPNCIARLYFRIGGFRATIISATDTLYTTQVLGNALPQRMIQLIKELKSGDKINFSAIRNNGPDDAYIADFYVIVR